MIKQLVYLASTCSSQMTAHYYCGQLGLKMFGVVINETCYTAISAHIDHVVYFPSHDRNMLNLTITETPSREPLTLGFNLD